MSAVELRYEERSLPVSWPDHSVPSLSSLVSDVVDQGWCDNSWAVSALTVAQDRISLANNRQDIMFYNFSRTEKIFR